MSAKWVIAGVLLVIVFIAIELSIEDSHDASRGQGSPPAAEAPARAAPGIQIDKSGSAQEKRAQLIQELIDKDVISKNERVGSAAEVWVEPLFFELDYDQKKSFLNMIWAYDFEPADLNSGFIFLRDSKTGKDAGTYGPVMGLELK